MRSVRSLIYLVAVGVVVAGAAAWAEDEPGSASPLAPDHSATMQSHEGGATGHGMMGMMGGDPAQMNRMMENCNQMMESWLQSHPQTPAQPPPDQKN